MTDSKPIVDEAVALVVEAVDGMNSSLDKFMPKTVNAYTVGMRPKSYLRHGDAFRAAIEVLNAIKADDIPAAKYRLEAARNSMKTARISFEDDEKMHREIDEELDNFMGKHK